MINLPAELFIFIDNFFTIIFYASTTLLPTLAFMSFLLLAYLAKLATAFVMLFCQLANQKEAINARIFSILGVMTLPIGAIAALFHHLLEAPG